MNITEQWLRDHMAAALDGEDRIVCADYTDDDGARVTISVAVAAFAEMFAGADVAGTAEQVRDALHAVNTTWVDAEGNPVAEGTPDAELRDLGYGGYIDAWYDAGLLA